jgi:hypothetical protein
MQSEHPSDRHTAAHSLEAEEAGLIGTGRKSATGMYRRLTIIGDAASRPGDLTSVYR